MKTYLNRCTLTTVLLLMLAPIGMEGSCPSGHYCPTAEEQIPCPKGFYNPYNDSTDYTACSPCPGGMYCATEGISQPTGLCSPGYYCPGAVITSKPIGKLCYPTRRCPQGSSNPLICELGQYQPDYGQESCIPCPIGHFCRAGILMGKCDDGYKCDVTRTTQQGDACNKGHYCLSGMGVEIPCPPGTMQNKIAEKDCQPCPVGKYCATEGLETFTGPCAAGWWCGLNSTQATPDGQTCPRGNACPNGIKKECGKGHYQPNTGKTVCIVCPTGNYCGAVNTVSPTACAQGQCCHRAFTERRSCHQGDFLHLTYAAANRPTFNEAIALCTAEGPEYKLAVIDTQEEYNRVMAWFLETSPYVAGGVLNLPAPVWLGAYWRTPGFFKWDHCLLFPNLTWNLRGPVITTPTIRECLVLTLAKLLARSSCDNKFDILCEACSSCHKGSYYDTITGSCQLCPAGLYCDTFALMAPSGVCDDGWYCEEGSYFQNQAKCHIGAYCRGGIMRDCPNWTYQPLYGQSECLPCPAGRNCNSTGLVYPQGLCPVGYYCTAINYQQCPIGHYCPTGSATPIPCKTGYYQSNQTAGFCEPCPVGYYCDKTEAEAEQQSGVGYPTHGVVTPKQCPSNIACMLNGAATPTCDDDPYVQGVLDLSISCSPNCDLPVSSQEGVEFTVACSNCSTAFQNFTWSVRRCWGTIEQCGHCITRINYIDGLNSPSFVYSKRWSRFDVTGYQTVAVVVKVVIVNNDEGMAYTIYNHLQVFDPWTGPVNCVVTPAQGYHMETLFNISCDPVAGEGAITIEHNLYAYDVLLYQGAPPISDLQLPAPNLEDNDDLPLHLKATSNSQFFYHTDFTVKVNYHPVDGSYTEWTLWGTCTQTCGTGRQTRSRDCTNPVPQYGGAACLEDFSETQDCNVDPCPIDGGYTEWTLWGTCSQTCGTGRQTRSRDCTNPAPQYGGADCLVHPSEAQNCNTDPCPIDGGYTEWTLWGTCSQTCGTGSQTRSRDCTNPTPQYGGTACLVHPSEAQHCNTDPCPIDGGYTEWTLWGSCSKTCGLGIQTRSRDCTNPIPQYGGTACLVHSLEAQNCNTDPCPIDGGYTEWTLWGTCSQTCGTGSQTRSRDCTNPIPQYGGSACLVHSLEAQHCNTDPCPIDGGYTEWTLWGSCSKTCGTGIQTRSRDCTNPIPQYGGTACLVHSLEAQNCNTDPCPIDGGYTEWTLWGTCTQTCGTGRQTRSRDCTNPVPQYGGTACLGDPSETQYCNADTCPIDGGFTEWTLWGACTNTCGTGSQTRSRDCTNPVPQYGGAACLGDPSETQACYADPCPVDGGYTEWTLWGTCSQTCGTGRQTRARDCTNPVPQYGGAACLGDPSETQACNADPCPDPYDPGTLKIQLSCEPRCTSLMSSAEVINLHTVCQDCHDDVSGYTWTLRQCHSYKVEDCNHYLHLFYVVNNSSSILQFDPANPGHQVSDWTHLGMFVKVKLTDGNQGMTYHILRLFDPASPPVPCSVAPTTGISLSTLYSVVCEDVDTPEIYNITYSLYNHVSLQVLVYKSGTANVTEILLPPGYEGSQNTVNLQMVARIQGHLFYQTEIPVQVKPAAIDDIMKNLNSGNASDTEQDGASVIDQQLEEGNVFAAVRMLESVAEILNHASDGENATQENGTSSQSGTKTETQDSKTLEKFRTQLTKSVAKINISSYELVSTVSVVLNKVTEKSEELSEEAREIATGMYSNLAESLAQSLVTSQEDVTEKEVTNTAGAILQGAGAMIAMYTDAFEKETKPSENDTPEETSGTQTTIKPATQNTAKKIEMTEKLLKTVNTVCDALLDRQIQDAKPTVIVTENVQISVQKLSPSKLGGAQIEVESPRDGKQASRVTMPQSLGLSSTSKDYRLRTVVLNKNPYAWTANASQVKTSVISIALIDSDNSLVEVADLQQPVKLFIPAEFNTANAQSLKQIVPVDKKRDSLDITPDDYSTSKAALSLPLISNKVTILRFAFPVNLKSIKIHINETSSLNLQDLLQDDTYSTQVSAFLAKFGDHMGNDNSSSSIVFFIPSSSFDLGSENAEINLGLSLDMGDSKTIQTLGHLDPDCEGNQDLEKCQGYLETEVSFSIHMMQCLYWNETMQVWSQAGCLISAETSSTSLNCECDHLSSFAGSIFFLPSVINPIQDLALFLTVFENPVVVTTVLIVWMIYVFLLLWARRADMKDEEKEGVVKCAGSSPSDRYGYLVCVVTGWWRHAGTTANVFFYIKGTLGESPRTSLASSFRKCMQSGSEDWFLLTTKYSLGNLLSVTLWHDNSGTSPQWFLNRVLVKDIQRGVSWMFVCNDWLAADRGLLGLTSITIEPISEEQLRFRQKFNFLLQATSNLRNGHIWISVFTRPSGNWFTRVQRLSCCLSILLTTMLSDLMFTGIPTDDPEDQLTAGTFRLSLSQLAIGIWSSIIVFPINFIIIQLFLKSKPKPKHHYVTTDPSTTNPLATEHFATGGSPLQQSSELEMGIFRQGSASGKNMPWWCLIIGWCLVILVTVVCSYFVMLYGLKYGYTRSAEWLVSFLTGFFHSILIQEPVKAVAMALIIIFVLRRTVQFEDIETQMQEDCDEDFEHGVSSQSASHQPYLEPLSSRLLQQIRIRLKLEWLMDITLKDLIIQVVYLTFLLIILNSRKPVTTAYRSALTVRNLFVNSSTRMEISKVKTSGDFYTYLHETLVPAMEEVTATGEQRGVTLGSNHHLVGPYRLRQLRVKNDTCTYAIQSTVPKGCAKGYTTSLEDTDNYDTSWSPAPLTLDSSSPWVYREPNQLNTMSFPGLLATYPGSGYVVNMSADVKQHHDVFASLEKTGWFDRRTRAVLLEFSLYNPSIDLFNVVVILFEHASIGSVFPTHHIYTTSMFRYLDDSETYVLICEILFLVLSIMFAYIQIVKCRKVGGRTYISDAWNWAELVQIALSFAAVTLFIHRYVIVEEVLSSFKRGQGKTFVNFNPMVASDLAIDYVTACLLSVLIMKVLQFLQFHWRMKLISKTLFHVRSSLLNFIFLFFIVIVAFSHSSYLIFQKALSPYRDFRQAIFSNICMLTGNADVNVITENFQVLGNLFVLMFIVFGVFCLVALYAVILNVGRIQVRDAAWRQRNKFAFNNYIMNRLRVFLGIK